MKYCPRFLIFPLERTREEQEGRAAAATIVVPLWLTVEQKKKEKGARQQINTCQTSNTFMVTRGVHVLTASAEMFSERCSG